MFWKNQDLFLSQKRREKEACLHLGLKENKLPYKPAQTISACGSTFKKGRINSPKKANQVWKVIKINSLGWNNMKNKDCMSTQKENGSKPAAYDKTH